MIENRRGYDDGALAASPAIPHTMPRRLERLRYSSSCPQSCRQGIFI